MRVSVHLVTYQSMPDIVEALASLRQQTFTDFRVVVVDNASRDGTIEFIASEYGSRVALIRNYRNLGFAAAHNQAIEFASLTSPEFVLVMNPDVVLFPSTIAELLMAAERHPKAGAVTPRLLRSDGITLDSTGIDASRGFRFSDRGAGKRADGNYLKEEEVFGASGALVLYRAAALADVNQNHECFDRDFFAYKEDIDLAFRLRWRGWETWYAPEAVARHERSVGSDARGLLERVRARRLRSQAISRWSYRNHWWVMIKNAPPNLVLRNAIHLFLGEFVRATYLFFFEFFVFGGLFDALAGFPRMLKKRQAIVGARVLSPRGLNHWFR